MTHFCQNKLCRAHVDLGPVPEATFIDSRNETVRLRRMKIVNAAEKKEFDFCEVCANVLATVHGKQE